MSKFNNQSSLDIDSIKEEELDQAFKEWAEGNEHLEKFLRNCYGKGVKTSGSHGRNSSICRFSIFCRG